MSGATIGSELPLFVVPYRQNVNFTGREEQLRQIEQRLDPAQGHVMLVIAGLGGLGKTQLTLEYSYRQRDAYDLVYWLKAGDPATLGVDLSVLAETLGLAGEEIGDQEALRRRLFAWLESTEARWLLVYDNADAIKPADLNDYLPQAGNGHVLITSRNPRWRKMAAVLELGVFEPGEAAAFLKKRNGRDGGQGAADLAEALGYLPLALEHAAAYSEETGAGFTAYRSYFDEQRAALWADAEPPDVYHATVSTTWELSLKRIEDEAAIQLLELCSFLAPDDIPLSLLRSPDNDVPLPAALRAALHDPLRLDKAIAGLRRYSLLAREDDLLSVHRLVQAIMRDRMGAERASEWANVAIGLFLAAFPEDLQYSWHTWHDGPRLLSHVAAAVGYADRRGVELEQVALLYNETGYYLNQFGDSAGARPYYERALAINEKVLGAEHPDTARSLNNLGALLDTQGEYEAARPYFERALAINEKVLGAEHPDTALSLNNLGFLLDTQGEYAAARPYYERALDILESQLGPDHPNTITSRSNLDTLLLQMEAAEAYAGDSYQVNLEGSGAIAQGEGTIAAGERGVLVGGDVGGSIITGSGNIIQEFAPGAKSLAAERIRLDVAHPEQAFVDEPFELAVAVRQPDAPPISVEELTRVVSEEGTVYRPADEEVIRYRIEVSGGDDWEIDPPSYDILLRRGENGPPRFFQVTALRQGRGTLLVNAYQEDQALAAQTRIRIEVQIPVEKKIDPTHEQEVHQMDIILTPAEAEQFHEALLAAFNRSELKQVVYFSLETPYEEIVASGAFSSEVYSLVLWVNKQNKVMALLKEARERNEGNVELREFEEAIVAKYAIGPAEDDQEEEPESETPEQDPRKALIDELLRLPVATTQAGRTSLLHGIPGANTLNRDMNIARLDLDLIVTQLAERGRLANGQLALVMLIDNALPYAEGFEAEPRLKKIRQQLLAA